MPGSRDAIRRSATWISAFSMPLRKSSRPCTRESRSPRIAATHGQSWATRLAAEQLNTWIAEPRSCPRGSHRAELASFDCVTAAAEGGTVWLAHSGVPDAVTGLEPSRPAHAIEGDLPALKTFDITPNEAYCFVVIDADTDDLAPFGATQ